MGKIAQIEILYFNLWHIMPNFNVQYHILLMLILISLDLFYNITKQSFFIPSYLIGTIKNYLVFCLQIIK